MGMVAYHHVGAQFQELQITVTGIGAGQAGEFLAAVGNHDAPAAFGFDFLDASFNVIQVIPAENAGFGGGGGDALGHVGNAEHADTAGFLQVNRLGSFHLVEASAEGLAAHFSGDFPGADDALGTGVHGMVVADGPDVGTHLLQNLGCFGVHAVEENTTAAVVHRIDQGTLHVGADMVSAV